MGRRFTYPELADLSVGEALFIELPEVDLVKTRVMIHAWADRQGLKFETHYDTAAGELEVARLAQARPGRRRGEATARSRSTAELHAEVARRAAELRDAADE